MLVCRGRGQPTVAAFRRTWFALQLALADGARVVGAARGPEKLAFARASGAEVTVDYSAPGWVERVREATGGRGSTWSWTAVAGDLGEAAFGALADGGRFLGHGSAGGRFSEVDPHEAGRRGIEVLGLVDLEDGCHGEPNGAVHRILEPARTGRVVPHVGLTVPLERAEEAHRALEERRVLGKVLLVP